MSQSHEEPNQDEALSHNSHLPIGAAAMSGVEYGAQDQGPDFYDDGADEYWAEYDDYYGTVNGCEDPLSVVAEDQKETKIDQGADEYWAEYDDYFGTVNGGEDPLTDDVDRWVDPNEAKD